MFPTKHCFDDFNEKDSLRARKRNIMGKSYPITPILVLITIVISCVHAKKWEKIARKSRAYGEIRAFGKV